MAQTRLFYSFQCHGKWYCFLNVYASLISIYIVEYYSAIKKKNENLPCATWMDFEGIMPESEISDTKKDKYCLISLMCVCV